jgi:hypothetical protein
MIKQGEPVAPELHLLKCLELLHLKHLEAAETALVDFKNTNKESDCHPLYFLAVARLLQLLNSKDAKYFFSKFEEKCPSQVDNWLDVNEKQILTGELPLDSN